MLTIASAASSGPDILLVCGCKDTTFPKTYSQNTLIQNKPKLQYAHNS